MENAAKAIGFTPEALWITAGTLIALLTAAVLIMNAIRLFREIRKPDEDSEKTLQEKLRSNHERLNCLENSTQKQDDELQLLLRGSLVMIHRMVYGNSVHGLKEMQKQIEDYLVFGKQTGETDAIPSENRQEKLMLFPSENMVIRRRPRSAAPVPEKRKENLKKYEYEP